MATTNNLTAAQRMNLNGIVATVRDCQANGTITHDALYNVIEKTGQELPNEILATAHGLLLDEYEKDNTLTLLRSALSALSIIHYRRLLGALRDMPTHALFAVWEANEADEMSDPIRLERNAPAAYQRIITDRLIEKMGDDVWEALDKLIDTFPDVEGEELPARLVRYKAHEIAGLRALHAAV